MTSVRSRLAAGLLAAAAAAALTGCGTSLDAQTYQERSNAEADNKAVGTLAVRGVYVEAPETDEGYAVGDDATVRITVTNASPEEDRLLSVTSSAAEEVVVLAGGRERDMVVPPTGSTGDFVVFELRGLTRALRPAEYADLTLRFEGAGEVEVLAPVQTTGETDRPVYPGEREEGGEEPALQAPAGGHHDDAAAGEGGEEGAEESGTFQGEPGAEGSNTEVEAPTD